MKQTVKIYKSHNKIKVKFLYNDDLIDIMREFQGWYFKKEKAWIFPLHKLSDIRDKLIHEMYKVDILTEKTHTPTVEESFKDKDAIQVYGICKKCGEGAFVNRRRLCNKCSWLLFDNARIKRYLKTLAI